MNCMPLLGISGCLMATRLVDQSALISYPKSDCHRISAYLSLSLLPFLSLSPLVIKTCFVTQSITTTCPFARPLLPSSSSSRPTDRRRSRRNSRASVISGICASAFPRPAHWFRPFKSSVRFRPSARAYCIETPNLNGRKNRHIQFYERSGAR